MSKVDIYQQEIHNIFPDLSIEEISLNDSGLDNDIIEVNSELIFRFPKHQNAVDKLNKEIRILKLIREYITLKIPDIFYEHQEVVGYFMICGVAFRKEILSESDERTQQLVAEEIATFLKELHSVPKDRLIEFNVPNAGGILGYEDWLNLSQRLQDDTSSQEINFVQASVKQDLAIFLDEKSNFEYEPKLIHGSLESDHILFNKQKNRLGGIIDFGTAGLGDPAVDLAALIRNYGEAFVSRFYRIYPELEQLYIRRAKFYVKTFVSVQALSKTQSNESL